MLARRSFTLLLCVLVLGNSLGCNGAGGINSGDRVLVAKCLYETGIKPPERFDVVVFKYPGDARHGLGGPMKEHVPTNYIKRLLGLPGEIIAIFFGQIFRMTPPPGEAVPGVPTDVDAVDLWKAPNQPNSSAKSADFQNQVQDWFAKGKFEIVRKPPPVMLAMRRIVNDNDHQPQDLKSMPEAARWRVADKSGWTPSADRTSFSFKPNDGKVIDWLTYQHRVRPDGPLVGGASFKPQLITDSMGYNDANLNGPPTKVNWVGDLMLEATVKVTQPTGEFFMELSRGPNRFQAKWDLASGQCTLSRIGDDGQTEELGSAATTLRGVGEHLVRFANFDSRLTVWVDRTLPFNDGVPYDPPEFASKNRDGKVTLADLKDKWGPRLNDLERPAGFGGKDAAVDVSKISLWRDTYYTATDGIKREHDQPSEPDVAGLTPDVLSKPGDWGAFKEVQPAAFYVYPKHYLCLGDNSTHSSDSRVWGLVPERLMLGRALMVYYPVNRAGLIR